MNHRSGNASSSATSKGQNLTLLVFGGLVVLCSIFFVLGMMVGRAGFGAAEETEQASVPEMPAEPEADLTDDLTFYDSVGESDPPGLEPVPEPAGETASVAAPGDAGEDEPDPAGQLIFLQVAALSSAPQADSLLDQLLEDGFPAFLVRPEPSDDVQLHRVRVGPFATQEAASLARRALEEQGFNPIVAR